jgi:hypothetical protein
VVVDLISKVGTFTKAGQVHVMTLLSDKLQSFGLVSSSNLKSAKIEMEKRATLGLHPIGLTAVIALLFVGAFLFIAAAL